MFKPKYLIRLDDACPTMDSAKWSIIENILDKYNVKPIVAIIPNNEDQTLMPNIADDSFWKKAINWQRKGWGIALHGYNHVYKTMSSGIISLNQFSEFAGENYSVQSNKIIKGIKILESNGIYPEIWVAPGHTFDNTTIKVLKENTNIKIISDGHSFRTWREDDFIWIPQQFEKPRSIFFGTWTFCLHPNTMSENQFVELEKFLNKNSNRIYTYSDLLIDNLKNKHFSNKLFTKMIFSTRRLMSIIRKIR